MRATPPCRPSSMALLHACRSDAKHDGKLKLLASRSTGHQEIKLFFQNTLMHLQQRATCMQHWTASAFRWRRNQTLSSIPSLLHPLARHVINITNASEHLQHNEQTRAHLHHRGDRWIAGVCWDHADIRLQITAATLLWSIYARMCPPVLVTVETMVWPAFSWSWPCPILHLLDPATAPHSTHLNFVRLRKHFAQLYKTRLQLIDNKIHESIGITHGLQESCTSDKRWRITPELPPARSLTD